MFSRLTWLKLHPGSLNECLVLKNCDSMKKVSARAEKPMQSLYFFQRVSRTLAFVSILFLISTKVATPGFVGIKMIKCLANSAYLKWSTANWSPSQISVSWTASQSWQGAIIFRVILSEPTYAIREFSLAQFKFPARAEIRRVTGPFQQLQ